MDRSQDPKHIHDLRSALTRLEFFLRLLEQPEEAKRLQSNAEQWSALVTSAQKALELLKSEIEKKSL